MTDTLLTAALTSLMECLGRTWADALSRLRSAPHEAALSDTAPADIGPQPLWLTLTLEGVLNGEAALVIASADVALLLPAAGSSAEADSTSPDQDAIARAVNDLLRQPLVIALQDFQTRNGPLVAHIKVSEAPTWTPQKTLTLVASAKDMPPVAVSLFCSEGLTASATPTPSLESQGGLDRVLDARLEISLRFGQQHLPLGELAALGPGSVVELDRKVQEPVELVLGGKILARGNVVIVDGNYGLRVTELCDWR